MRLERLLITSLLVLAMSIGCAHAQEFKGVCQIDRVGPVQTHKKSEIRITLTDATVPHQFVEMECRVDPKNADHSRNSYAAALAALIYALPVFVVIDDSRSMPVLKEIRLLRRGLVE